MVTTLNTGNSQRVTRRIIAEDNDWTLQVSYVRNLQKNTKAIINFYLLDFTVWVSCLYFNK